MFLAPATSRKLNFVSGPPMGEESSVAMGDWGASLDHSGSFSEEKIV